ncbi:hypothetical protein [Actinacidiphila guanduensis]|uniref:Uncharacterized protein n=1 Tax=Actinacidiphila guanduensis TaxID=310781 RepID=A0A1H0PJR9_9ACTN|nr:hypothetical protein [Actinacidiphila guanduensis]SDP05317.1 hypothetical protein SAMN05216259_11675 [Actinacidiphila guanduensis]
MLSLRVLKGSGPAAASRWLLVGLASCGTGLLLLGALGWALAHPNAGTSDAVVRLGWCVVPVVVTVQLAVAVARAQPAAWPRAGLDAAGLGRSGLVLLGAASAAVVCAAGSVVALPLFLLLRGDLAGGPYHGIAPGLLATGHHLPPAGVVTLLAVVPVAAGVTAATGRLGTGRRTSSDEPSGTPSGLPWGIALVAAGLGVEAGAPGGHDIPLPSGLGSIASAAAGGWVLAAVGLVLAGPGLVHLGGRLLAAFRPGAIRLLSGRALQQEAHRIGPPLGLLSAATAAAVSAHGLRPGHPLGHVTVFAATLVAVCVLAIAAMAAVESRSTRRPAAATMRDLAVSPAVLRSVLALRAGVLLVAFLLPALLVAAMSPKP